MVSKNENEIEYALFLKQVGKRIKSEREKAGLSQERLAEQNGVDYKYYQRIEYGEVNITVKTLYKISKTLNLDPSQLLDLDK